jgi:hypothetical protein
VGAVFRDEDLSSGQSILVAIDSIIIAKKKLREGYVTVWYRENSSITTKGCVPAVMHHFHQQKLVPLECPCLMNFEGRPADCPYAVENVVADQEETQ